MQLFMDLFYLKVVIMCEYPKLAWIIDIRDVYLWYNRTAM